MPVRRVTRRALEGDSPYGAITRYTTPPPAINPTRAGILVGEQADTDVYQSGRRVTHSPDPLLPGRGAYTALSTRPATQPASGPQTGLATTDQQDSLPNPFRSRNSHEYLHDESSNGHSAGDYSGTTSGAGSGTSGGFATTTKENGPFSSPPARESTASLGDNEDYTARRVLKVRILLVPKLESSNSPMSCQVANE
jgi:hypothetical protein